MRANFEWRRLGPVTMVAAKPTFPAGRPVPGVWRVSAGTELHHGAAKDLRAAMYQLTTPGPTQTTNQRVHRAASIGLQRDELVVVDVITSAEVDVEGRRLPLDLTADENRAFIKAAAVLASENPEADPASAEYRRALAAAQRAVKTLADADLMRVQTDGKPAEPDKRDVKALREASMTLAALVSAYDRYWPRRWGHEGNPGGS